MEKETKKRSKTAYFVIVGVSTAILLVTPVLILMGAGFMMDRYFSTGPYILIAGGVIGFVGGMMNVYKLLTKMKQ